ncbi:Cof-type HAD-IIB family hydrolase [Bacillus sp. FJAT-50079]|uniref:Cof-type HAD-IIB family hydrolase n=1 Tax=Bacillus sp. FJAT-50079 TaxID=2833577 RepID=UPI001BC9ED7E|nr:Cof-type HAD-IIB family hydrolase [Bacillus sp. FJAT-50079]MBS4206862.1 HAD family phosphatase [Bacillus sp. FJAT-50079]
MIKCIASDMDGTLLNAKQEVSEATVQAIKAAQEQGIDFIVATGRAYSEVRYVLDRAGIDCPAICVNGGEIRDKDGNVSFSVGLDGETSTKITSVFSDLDIYFELYTRGGTYTTSYENGIQVVVDIFHTANPSMNIEEIRKSADDRFNQRLIKVIDDYGPIFAEEDCHVYKFLAFSRDEETLEKARTLLKEIAGIEVTSSGRNNLEVMHYQAQKGAALQRYTEAQGISLADTMALGDNYNDISMLEIAGHSVAMGNGEKPVKEIAKHVTDTNDNDGVAKAIVQALEGLKISK